MKPREFDGTLGVIGGIDGQHDEIRQLFVNKGEKKITC